MKRAQRRAHAVLWPVLLTLMLATAVVGWAARARIDAAERAVAAKEPR